ncbi:GSU2403 family nucleotidyltransferase fold protein [Candidatus Margulisiibacteriota bacterium]
MSLETENKNLFLSILIELNRHKALDKLILIGSWCLPVYKSYFENDAQIPIKRTFDIDFLVPRPFHSKKEINIPEILDKFNFKPVKSLIKHYTKYVHPDIEIEFLSPELGKGINKPLKIPELYIETQTLRYLTFLQENTIRIKYENMSILVPEPTAFTLHKYLLSSLRQKEDNKAAKDLETANEMAIFLVKIKSQVIKLKELFQYLPKTWQKKLIRIINDNNSILHDLLNK